ncbi:class I SAM-dependent methyltransferase [Streptomyces sp. BPTC-684]|uniref:class I SAM-dependent methyltransferase n=1 Tax=Streptomyces sp. BPTC-684 TaxID=3043734 RepID=UPI0024B158C4|nr:class I SAM-dependent methyltransferase [Streptomyces sp. BPTC-684]WHM40719.1 class I SAM-dependent methyltransferase [Streptomyces sp. BPTC-684]
MTDSAEFWDRRYTHGNLGWTLVPHPLAVAELALVPPDASAGPNAPGRLALDLGAGAGRHSLWLARRGWRVTAVDFSATALERTRRDAAAEELDVTTVLADLDSYEPRQGAFGVILITYVHPEPPLRAALLARAAKALAPGGRLVVVGHHLDNLGRGLEGPSDPERMFTPERLSAELPDLRVERAERVVHIVPTASGEREAYATVIRASRATADRPDLPASAAGLPHHETYQETP